MRICLAAGSSFEELLQCSIGTHSCGSVRKIDETQGFQRAEWSSGRNYRRPGLSKGDRGELIATTILMLARDKQGTSNAPVVVFAFSVSGQPRYIVQAAMPSLTNTEGA